MARRRIGQERMSLSREQPRGGRSLDEVAALIDLSRLLFDLGDCSAIPSVAASLPGTCGRYGVLYLIGAQVLTYDTGAFPDRKPATWADFWNVEDVSGPPCAVQQWRPVRHHHLGPDRRRRAARQAVPPRLYPDPRSGGQRCGPTNGGRSGCLR